jgi:hypothetical protein
MYHLCLRRGRFRRERLIGYSWSKQIIEHEKEVKEGKSS